MRKPPPTPSPFFHKIFADSYPQKDQWEAFLSAQSQHAQEGVSRDKTDVSAIARQHAHAPSSLTELLHYARARNVPPHHIASLMWKVAEELRHSLGKHTDALSLEQLAGLTPPIDYDQIHRHGQYRFLRAEEPNKLTMSLNEKGYLTAKSDGVYLDIGCGNGRDVLYAGSVGVKAMGIDEAPTAVDTAKERAKQLQLEHQTRFVRTRAEKLLDEVPDIAGQIATVTCNSVLHLMTAQDSIATLRALQEAILTKNGVVGVAQKTEQCAINTGGIVLEQGTGYTIRLCQDGIVRRFLAADVLANEVAASGMHVVEIEVDQRTYASDHLDEFVTVLAKKR